MLFLALLVLGVPIYLALGTTGALMFGMNDMLLSFAQKLVDELNSTTLLAVPYFVIAATLMERGGVAITWQTYTYGDFSTTSLRFPLWIYGAALPVGALLMAVAYAVRCINLFRRKR